MECFCFSFLGFYLFLVGSIILFSWINFLLSTEVFILVREQICKIVGFYLIYLFQRDEERGRDTVPSVASLWKCLHASGLSDTETSLGLKGGGPPSGTQGLKPAPAASQGTHQQPAGMRSSTGA